MTNEWSLLQTFSDKVFFLYEREQGTFLKYRIPITPAVLYLRPKLRFYPRSELGSDINPKAAILAKTEQRENYFWQHQIIAIMQHKYEHKMIESMIQMQFLSKSLETAWSTEC